MSEDLLRVFTRERIIGSGETLDVSMERTPPLDEARTVEADKTNGMVRALDATGRVIAMYPATIGSEDTPSPKGEYQGVRS